MNKTLKLGYCPTRRDVFSREEAIKFNKIIRQEVEKFPVEIVDLAGINEEELLFSDSDIEKVIERFSSAKIDALFFPHCNFGSENRVAKVAKALSVPVLLWGPRDDAPDEGGLRSRDSQCGLFGVSRQMQRYHIPFSHLPCCKVDSQEFKEGFESFVRVACMVKNFAGMRIGQIGARPAPFFSVIWNEGELMEKFGIKIIPFNFAIIEQRMKATAENCQKEIAEIEEYIVKNYTLDELTPKFVKPMATLAVMYKNLFEEYDLDVISAECWTATPVMFDGLAPCTVYGLLNDMGYLISCESDMHCALTMVLLESATLGKGRPLFGEFTVRHPENKNAELLWHCGPFPLSQKAPDGIDSEARLVNQRSWFRAKDGVYTVARIDQESGDYMILPLVCKTTKGPQTHGTYIWGEFDNLQAIEDRLIDGPYIHHFVEIEGDWRKEINEFCKYFPALKVDKSLESK